MLLLGHVLLFSYVVDISSVFQECPCRNDMPLSLVYLGVIFWRNPKFWQAVSEIHFHNLWLEYDR